MFSMFVNCDCYKYWSIQWNSGIYFMQYFINLNRPEILSTKFSGLVNLPYMLHECMGLWASYNVINIVPSYTHSDCDSKQGMPNHLTVSIMSVNLHKNHWTTATTKKMCSLKSSKTVRWEHLNVSENTGIQARTWGQPQTPVQTRLDPKAWKA